MSALLAQLASQGITAEDLNKAASVRLFEKVAAAEGIDLNSMTEQAQDAMFAQFENDILPEMVGDKTASAPTQGGMPSMDDIDPAKLASAIGALSDDDKFGLFEQQAAYEGLDLEQLDDTKLASAYGTFIEDYLPLVVVNDGNPIDMGKVAEQEEAAAKLAEADILGRQMARSFHDESLKLAGGKKKRVKRVTQADRPNMAMSDKQIERAQARVSSGSGGGRTLRQGSGDSVRGINLPATLAHGRQGRRMRLGLQARGALGAAQNLARQHGKKGLVGAGVFTAGVAGKKGYDHVKTNSAPALDALALERANEMLKDAGLGEPTIDDAVEARAVEILEENGYIVS